jgi:pimeloyl-ACP methyl ester carboxylesterase
MVAWLSVVGPAPVLAGEPSDAGKSGQFQVVSTRNDSRISSPLVKIDTIVQNGPDSRDRFTMHTMYRHPGSHDRGTILLIPSLVSNFDEYLLNENGDRMDSLAAMLALEGYVVYGYSPRTAQIPVNGCSTLRFDCSIMGTWGFAAYLSDIDYIRQQATHGEHKPVIGGLSLGGMLAIAAVNVNPSGYAGLWAWDAIMYSRAADVLEVAGANCAALQFATLSLGAYFEEGLPNAVKFLVSLGEQSALLFFGVPQPGLGAPYFIQLAPNATFTGFRFASFPRVVAQVNDLNNVESLPILRDGQCAFSGDRTFTGNLASWFGPVLALEMGLGWGTYMHDTLGLMSSTDITIYSTAQFGHLDAYTIANHEDYVDRPLLTWLEHVFPVEQ